MNNPLDYEPHPLCIQACREVQEMLARREDWQEEIARGKMFGVLIVENVKTDTDVPKWGYPAADSEALKWGYLAAYSGQIGGRSDWEDFVPAVFDYLQPDGYFRPTRQNPTYQPEHQPPGEGGKDEGSQNPDPATAGGAEAYHRRLSGEDEGSEGKT